jgi:acyl carrier protein
LHRQVLNEIKGGVVMTLSSLSVTQRTAPQETFDSNKVRTLIAEYLGIDAKRVTDETHFSEFGMDRYDRLELMILIEDAFTGVEIADDNADQIEVVGDLIRHIEGSNEPGGRKLIPLT